MDRTLLFIIAAGTVCKLGIHAWYSWCIAMLVMLAIGVQAQDASRLQDNSSLPSAGVNVSQEAYRFEAFNSNELEDALIQNIPQGFTAEVQKTQPQELNQAPQQEYTILQEVAMFDYPATLCTVHRLWGYYDCVWRSHVRITTPAMVYQQKTVPVRECAIMDLTGIFRDPLS